MQPLLNILEKDKRDGVVHGPWTRCRVSLAFLASSVQPSEARLGVVSIRDDPDDTQVTFPTSLGPWP